MEGENPLRAAYGVLLEALAALMSGEGGGKSVRDSDLKRKMLQLEPSFDEGDLGFGKFSRFLRQAHDHEIIDLEKREEGTYQISPRGETLKKGGARSEVEVVDEAGASPQPVEDAPRGVLAETPAEPRETTPPEPRETRPAERVEEVKGPRRAVGVRRGGSRVRRGPDGPPPLLEGQVVGAAAGRPSASEDPPPVKEGENAKGPAPSIMPRTPRRGRGKGQARVQEELPLATVPSQEPLDLEALGLPTDRPALVRYLTNSYKGVGQKTAETLVDEFGSGLFEVLHREPERLGTVIMANRLDQLLQGWKADLGRRQGRKSGEAQGREDGPGEEGSAAPRRRTRKGTRGGRGRGSGDGAPKDPS